MKRTTITAGLHKRTALEDSQFKLILKFGNCASNISLHQLNMRNFKWFVDFRGFQGHRTYFVNQHGYQTLLNLIISHTLIIKQIPKALKNNRLLLSRIYYYGKVIRDRLTLVFMLNNSKRVKFSKNLLSIFLSAKVLS